MIFAFDEADIFKSKSLGHGRQTLHNWGTPTIQNVPSYSLVTFVMESFELVRGSAGNKDSGGGVTLRVQLATARALASCWRHHVFENASSPWEMGLCSCSNDWVFQEVRHLDLEIVTGIFLITIFRWFFFTCWQLVIELQSPWSRPSVGNWEC